MRFSATVLLLLVSQGTFAANGPFDNQSTELTSLNYYPHLGQFEISPHVTTTIENKSHTSAGAVTKVAYNQFYGSLSYGLAHRLRIAVNETILWDQVSDAISATNTETLTPASGPSDPSFIASWRYLEAARSGLSGDLSVIFNPSFGPKVIGDGSISKTGNNLAGGWVTEVSTSLFWRWRKNHFELSGTGTSNAGSITEGSSGGDSHTQAYWTSSVTATDRLHLSRNHFVQASFERVLTSHHSGTSAAGVLTKTDSPAYTSSNLEYGFSPDPNVVIEVSVTWRSSQSVASTPTATTTTSTHLTTSTLTLLHQF